MIVWVFLNLLIGAFCVYITYIIGQSDLKKQFPISYYIHRFNEWKGIKTHLLKIFLDIKQ